MTKFFDSIGLEIHPIMLTSPKHFHISALTEHSKEKFLSDTKDYVGMNKEFINFVRSVTQENIKQDNKLTAECTKHLNWYDTLYGYANAFRGSKIYNNGQNGGTMER